MTRVRLFFFAAGIVAIFATAGVPPEVRAASDKVTLGEVVITATKIEEPIEESTSDVTIITSKDIEKMNVGLVSQVLKRVAEIHITQNGGKGGITDVFMRGGSSQHTLVLIDGVKVQSTTTGGFDFAGIAVGDIERIEIVKGPQSTIYGSEAMAGVINIITKKPVQGAASVSLDMEGGSYGFYRHDLSVSGGRDGIGYRLAHSYQSSDGISSARGGNERDPFDLASMSMRVDMSFENFDLELSGRNSYTHVALDAFDFTTMAPADDPDYKQREQRYLLSGKGKLYLADNYEQVFSVSRFTDKLSLSHPTDPFLNANITGTTDTLEWQHNVFVTDDYTITAGAEYREEKADNAGNFKVNINNKALYVNNKLRSGELILNAGLRYDNHETFGEKTTYRLGALYDLSAVGVTLRGSYATGFRAPGINELYFPFYGNIALDPEQTKAWEIEAQKALGEKVSVSLTYFNQQYEDLIQTDPLTWTAANIADADVSGVEASVSATLMEGLSLGLGYTYMETEDKATGKPLSRRPDNKLALDAEYQRGDFSINADYTYVSERLDSAVGRDLDAYSLINLGSSYKVKNITFFARIENLLDEDYEEVGGYSTPGISFFGGVKTGF